MIGQGETNNNSIKSDRLIPKTCQFLIGLGFIGFATFRLSQSFTALRNSGKLKMHLQKAISLDEQSQAHKHQLHIIYASGKLHSSGKQPFEDSLFGLSLTNDSLGLYRKIEIYHPSLKFKVDTWGNINYVDPVYIDENYCNLKSKLIHNGEIKLNSYPISNGLAIQLAENHSQILQIDDRKIENHFEQLKSKLERLQKQKQIPKQNKSNEGDYSTLQLEGIYKLHPFKYSKEKKKNIYYEDNHIYICGNKDYFSQGDMRISFYDVQKITEATILAYNKQGRLEIHKIPDLNYDVKVYKDNGEFAITKLGLINFIQKGIIPYQEFIDQSVDKFGKNSLLQTFIYSLIIIAIYEFLYLQLFKQEDQTIEDINNVNIKNQIIRPNFFNIYLVDPFLHLGCLSLFLSGRILPFLALGSVFVMSQLSSFSGLYKSDTRYYDNLNKNKSLKK